MWRLSMAVTAFYLIAALSAMAGPLDGTKEISLLDSEGGRIVIGTVTFTPEGDARAYKIEWAEAPFSDHFLSMRPFRCLEGPAKHWCQVPYPYENNHRVSAGDLTDLEYDLLFLHKGATEYGIDMWNGVYYRLSQDGDRLTGTLHEMDMGQLSAPPEGGNLRPITEKDLHESDPESHWLPRVVIE